MPMENTFFERVIRISQSWIMPVNRCTWWGATQAHAAIGEIEPDAFVCPRRRCSGGVWKMWSVRLRYCGRSSMLRAVSSMRDTEGFAAKAAGEVAAM